MLSDLRFAFRQLWKYRGLTAVAVLTLGLGIGANTAIFSVVHSVLIKSLPYPEPDRLVNVFESVSDGGMNSVSGGAFIDWQEHSTVFEHLAVYEEVKRNLTGSGSPERVSGLTVSSEFLPALGIVPVLGRGFSEGEDQPGGENHNIVLTHGFWQGRWGSDPGILGKSLSLDQVSYRVIGVLPPESLMEDEAQFLVSAVVGDPSGQWQRAGHWRSVVGRLLPGVATAQAQAELAAVKARLNEQYPSFKEDWGVAVIPMQEVWSGNVRATLMLLLATVALVLLIACANVSNLLLARGAARSREMAIRGALGAHAWRIMRQMLIESLVLALAGCAFGLLLAGYGIELLAGMVADRLPHVLRPELDMKVLVFSLVAACGCGVLFGILPAWAASRQGVNNDLKEAVRGTTSGAKGRSQAALVVAEVAFTLVLLIAAGLFLRSFSAVMEIDPGFDPEQTLAFDLSFPDAKYPGDAERMAFIVDLSDRLKALPGVDFVGASSALPLSNNGRTEMVSRAELPERLDYLAISAFISGDYLAAMGMVLERGREPSAAESTDEGSRVLMIDGTLARDLYPNEDPIGGRLRFLGETWDIIGVVKPVRHWVLDIDPRPAVYLPQAYAPQSTSVVVRSSVTPSILAEGVRATVRAADSDQPIANVRTLGQAVDRSLAARRTTLSLLGAFAALAVCLAAIGIYGVMSFAVSQRQRELGIRSALGAQQADVVRLVLRGGLRLSWIGICVGLAAALASARFVESQLFEVNTKDPWVFVSSILFLATVAAISIYLPARRAAAADPVEALRAE